MSDTPLKAGLRERLGITEADASEDAILAALDEVLAEQAEAPTATLPDGVVTIEASVLEGLRGAAALAHELKAAADLERHKQLVATAVGDGRIPQSRAEAWMKLLKADEEGATAQLASLEKGTIPLAEIGHAGDVESEDDRIYAKWTNTEEA